MYCPKCATAVIDNQKFCRSCGFNLEAITEIVNNGFSANSPGLALVNAEQSRNRKKRLEIWGIIIIVLSLLIGCLIPIFIGMGIPNLTSVIILLAGIAGAILFAGAILLIYKDMPPANESISDNFSPRANLPRQKYNKKLPSANLFEPLPSVTEQTTDRLDASKVKVRDKKFKH